MNQSKMAASLTVLSSLFDEGHDILNVLAHFVNHTILTDNLFSFTSVEMKEKLLNNYGFEIPESVIRKACKRVNVSISSGLYTYNGNISSIKEISSDLENIEESHLKIVNNILDYIEKEIKLTLKNNEKDELINDFYLYILDKESYTDKKYTPYIASYIIKYSDDLDFVKDLEKIKEGLISYIGIAHLEDISQLGSWTDELILYLDTEILFHMAGYNGDLFKSLFYDFYNLILEINKKSSAKNNNKIIELRYFTEVGTQIEDFFSKATEIVNSKKALNYHVPAMRNIIKDTKKPSDIMSKKSDFYTLLKKHTITKETKSNFYTDENHKYNIDYSKQTIKKNTDEKKNSISIGMLQHINVLRKGVNSEYITQVKYLLITNTSSTLKTASEFNIKKEIFWAYDLDFITNIFWFKLSKGLSSGIPKNIAIVAKSQVVLSSLIEKTMSSRYEKSLKQLKNNEISEEIAINRIIDFRNKELYPEDINKENIDEIKVILTEENLTQYVEMLDYERIEKERLKGENRELQSTSGELEGNLVIANENINSLEKKINYMEEQEYKKNRREEAKRILKKRRQTKIKNFCVRVCIFIFIVFIVFIIFIAIFVDFDNQKVTLQKLLENTQSILLSIIAGFLGAIFIPIENIKSVIKSKWHK